MGVADLGELRAVRVMAAAVGVLSILVGLSALAVLPDVTR